MKILHFTPQPPTKISGGGLGVYQTIRSLAMQNNEIDYIGMEIDDPEIKEYYQNITVLKENSNFFTRAIDVLGGITNSRYRAWKSLNLDTSVYDLIVMDFTKADFIIPDIGYVPLIVKVHNVELDYTRNDYLSNKSLKKYVLYRNAYRQEKKILSRADGIMALTEKDIQRVKELYSIDKKMLINPVCVDDKISYQHKKNKHIELLITGSLWYESNIKGIIWFINNVFLSGELPDCILTIVGSNPNKELINLCNKNQNIRIVASPKDISQYFYNADIVICPIFEGAGMKVKVAEAISYGIPVVGTKHALIGYQISDGIIMANTSEEFLTGIKRISQLNDLQYGKIRENIHNVFKANYSMELSARQWQAMIDFVVGGK